jgi:hypothetical protein
MEVTIKIAAPEIVQALKDLAASVRSAHNEALASMVPTAQTSAKPSKAKLAPVVQDVPIAPPAPAAIVPRTLDEVKTLAALKAKKVGAAVIKGLIADTGSTQIADIVDPHVLASLAANLDAL